MGEQGGNRGTGEALAVYADVEPPFGIAEGQEIPLSDLDGDLDLPDDWPVCQDPECGRPILEYSGKGRRPKYHPEHRPSAKGSGGGRTRTSTERSGRSDKQLTAKLQGIASGLSENIQLGGALILPVLPVTGHIVLRDAEGASTALVKLARNQPKILLALERAGNISSGVTVGRFIAEIVTAAAVDLHRIEPDSMLPFVLGVTAMYNEVTRTDQQNAAAYIVPPPAASFI